MTHKHMVNFIKKCTNHNCEQVEIVFATHETILKCDFCGNMISSKVHHISCRCNMIKFSKDSDLRVCFKTNIYVCQECRKYCPVCKLKFIRGIEVVRNLIGNFMACKIQKVWDRYWYGLNFIGSSRYINRVYENYVKDVYLTSLTE